MKLFITPTVHQKVMHWVNMSNDEVSGLGLIEVVGKSIVVRDALMLPQKNGAATTDIEGEDACRLMRRIESMPGELRWWWHSHVNMGVFWSGTDTDTIGKMGQGGWGVATVFNKKREMKSSFYSPVGKAFPWGGEPLFLDDIETQIGDIITEEATKAWEEEYHANVKSKYVSHGSAHRDFRSGTTREVPTITNITAMDADPRLTKKELRALKRAQRRLQGKTDTDDTRWFDPFTSEELTFMYKHGVTPDEVKGLIRANSFDKESILLMIEMGKDAAEIIEAHRHISRAYGADERDEICTQQLRDYLG